MTSANPDEPPRLPADLDEVTASWLGWALLAGGRVDEATEVTAIDVEPLGASVGLLGDLARVAVRYGRGSGPSSVIVKVPPANPGGRQVGRMLRAWAREVAFYAEVAPASPGAKVPRCYYAGGHEEDDRWVVVLEDCPGQARTAAEGASGAQARLAVEALADFHAAWWRADHGFDWMPGFDSTGVGGLARPWAEAIPRALDRFGAVIPEPAGRWLQAFAPELAAWSDRAAAEPLTIVHADYRLDNLLLTDDAVTMIDWQTALRGPGPMDLSCFCLTSLTVADRRQHEPELLDRYATRLEAGGVELDRAWLERSYDETILFWMGQFANNLVRLEPEEPETEQAIMTTIERVFTAAVDRDVGRLVG